jgi:hypothetical protein
MVEWDSFFKPLIIPAEYSRFQKICDDQDALTSLGTWKNEAYDMLRTLNSHLAHKRIAGEVSDDTILANIVFHVSPFAIESENDGLDLSPWSAPAMQHIAVGKFFSCCVCITSDNKVPDQKFFLSQPSASPPSPYSVKSYLRNSSLSFLRTLTRTLTQ